MQGNPDVVIQTVVVIQIMRGNPNKFYKVIQIDRGKKMHGNPDVVIQTGFSVVIKIRPW